MFSSLLVGASIGNIANRDITDIPVTSPSPVTSTSPHHTDLSAHSITVNGQVYSLNLGSSFPNETISQDTASMNFAMDGCKFGINIKFLSDRDQVRSILKKEPKKEGESLDISSYRFAENLEAMMAFGKLNASLLEEFKAADYIQLVFFKGAEDLKQHIGEEEFKTLNITPAPCFSLQLIQSDNTLGTTIFIQENAFRDFLPRILVDIYLRVSDATVVRKIDPLADSADTIKEKRLKAIDEVIKIVAEVKKTNPDLLRALDASTKLFEQQIEKFKKEINGSSD